MSAKITKTKKRKPAVKTRKPKVKAKSNELSDAPADFADAAMEGDLEELERGIFFPAESAIEEALRYKCDVTEAELYLEKGRAQFYMGNFDYADNYTQLALNSAKESSKRARAEALFHEIARIIKDNSEAHQNIEDIETSYRVAEQHFEGGRYDEAIKSLESIKNDAIDSIFDNIIHETEGKLQNLADKIRDYRRKKFDVEKPLSILTKANEAFDENDYLTANEMVDKALQILNKLVEPELSAKAVKVIAKMNKLRDNDDLDKGALNEAAPFFEDLEKAFKAHSYEYIIEREPELSEIAERIIKIGKLTEFQQIQERIKALESNLKETENLGLDVSDIKKAVKKARSALDSRNFEISKDWLNKAYEYNEKIKDKFLEKKVESIIFSAQSLINEISETGADVKDAEKRLESAKKLLDEHQFDESRKIAEQTIIIARETLVGHINKRAETMLARNQKIIQDLNTRGLESSKLEKDYYQAQDAFQKGDFTTAIEILSSMEESAKQLLNKDLSKQVSGSLKQFEEKLSQAKEFDMPVDDFVAALEDVKKKLEDGNFLDAENIISANLDDLNSKLLDLSLRKKLNEILNDIETIRGLGAGVKRLEALRERASGSLNKGDLLAAEDIISKLYMATKKNLKETYSLQVGKQLRNLENKIKAVKDRGMTAPEIEIIYNDAVETLRNREYEQAIKLVKEGDDLIDGLVQEDQAIKLKRDLETLTAKIDELKITGLDVDAQKKELINAGSALSDNDFNKARDIIRQLEKDLVLLKESRKIKDLLDDIETEIKEVKSLGVNVSKLEQAYDQAYKSMKKNDLRRATDIGRDISSILSMIKKDRLKTQARELLDSTDKELAKSKENGMAVENSDDLMSQAKESFRRNEFEESITLSRSVIDILKREEKSKLTIGIQRKLEVFQFEIDQASSTGMDVNQYTKSIKDVRTLLEEGKPNPAQDVLNFAQRSFNKSVKAATTERIETAAPLQPPARAGAEAQVYASSSPVLPEEMADAPQDVGASPDKPPGQTPAGDASGNDKKKFNSLGNVGLKTLEKMSVKADNMMDFEDAVKLDDGIFDSIEKDLDMPFDTETRSSKPTGEIKPAKVKDDKLSEEEMWAKYKKYKAELDRLKEDVKRGMDLNLTPIESLMNASEIAISEMNFKTADKFLRESSDLVEIEIKPARIDFEIKHYKKELEDLWSEGQKTGDAETVLSEAKKSLGKKDYDEADKHLDNVIGMLNKFSLDKKIGEYKEKSTIAQKKIKDIEKLGISADHIKEISDTLSTSKQALDNDEVDNALEIVVKVIGYADELEAAHWNEKLNMERAEVQAIIDSINEIDKNELGEEPVKALDQARKLQDDGAFRKSLKIVMDTKKQLDKKVQEMKKKPVVRAKPIPETKDMIKAKMAFEKMTGKPVGRKEPEEVKVEEKASEKPEAVKPPPVQPPAQPPAVSTPTEEIKKLAQADRDDPEGYSRSLITDVVLYLQKVKTEGESIADPEKLLQQAKEEFICKNYTKSIELALTSQDSLMRLKPELFMEEAKTDIEDLNDYFTDLKSIGVETEPLERNMKIINDDFSNGEFLKVRAACEKLKNKAKRLKTEFLKVTLSPTIQELRSKVNEKRKYGIDADEIESYLSDAEDSIGDKDFEGASALYKKSLELFAAIPSEDEWQKLEVIKKTNLIRQSITQYGSYKIDFKDVEAICKSADDYANADNVEAAEEKLVAAESELNKLMNKYTKGVLSRVELEIEDVSLSGADTTSAQELLNKGKKLMETGDFNESIKTLIASERMAADTGDSFIKIFEGLRRLSRELAQIPPDAENYNEVVNFRNETKQKLEQKDYISALSTLNKAVTLLRESGNLSPELDSAMGEKPEHLQDDIEIKYEPPEGNVPEAGGTITLFIRNSGTKIYRRVEGNCKVLANDKTIQQKAFNIDDLMPNKDYKISLPVGAVQNFDKSNKYNLKVELSNPDGIIARSGIDL